MQPASRAGATLWAARDIGVFQATMAATTPTGSRTEAPKAPWFGWCRTTQSKLSARSA